MNEKLEDDPIVVRLRQSLDPPEGAARRLAAAALEGPGRRPYRPWRGAALVAAAALALLVWWRGHTRSQSASRITNTGEVVLAVGSNGERWLISGSGGRRSPEGMVLISKGGTQ